MLGKYCGRPPNIRCSYEPIYLECVAFLTQIELRVRLAL
jgi:hypothetical protein